VESISRTAQQQQESPFTACTALVMMLPVLLLVLLLGVWL
jgi:hypothetical protein